MQRIGRSALVVDPFPHEARISHGRRPELKQQMLRRFLVTAAVVVRMNLGGADPEPARSKPGLTSLDVHHADRFDLAPIENCN